MTDFDQFTFLSAEERELLEASVANDDTHDQLMDRLQDHQQEGETNMPRLAYSGGYGTRAGMGRDSFDVDDPHKDYPRLNVGTQRKLDTAAADYEDTVQVIDSALAKAEEAFVTAFERADAKAAIRRRIDGTANTKAVADAERRRNRIG